MSSPTKPNAGQQWSKRATPEERARSDQLRLAMLRTMHVNAWTRLRLSALLGTSKHTIDAWLADGYLPAAYHDKAEALTRAN